MNDIFDLPPRRELPPETKAHVRERTLTHLDERPARRGFVVPISVAAAVVVVLALVATGFVETGNGRSTTANPNETASPSTSPVPGDVRWLAPPTLYHVRDHFASAENTSRCVAQYHGPMNVHSWHPIMTASSNGVTLIAYQTPDGGPVFCELTPTTVTLSPLVTATGTQTEFMTSFGSIAGVVAPRYQWLAMQSNRLSDGKWQTVVTPAIEDGVFVAPNAVRPPVTSVTVTAYTSPEPIGPSAALGSSRIPAITPAITDRSATPAALTGESGLQLHKCVTDYTGVPLVNPGGWAPELTLRLDSHETLELSTQTGLMMSCLLDSTPQPPEEQAVNITALDGNPFAVSSGAGRVQDNDFARSDGMFYNWSDGASYTVVVVGTLTSHVVAQVRLVQDGAPTIIGTIHNGVFAIPGVDVRIYGAAHAHPALELLSATGAVLARLPLV